MGVKIYTFWVRCEKYEDWPINPVMIQDWCKEKFGYPLHSSKDTFIPIYVNNYLKKNEWYFSYDTKLTWFKLVFGDSSNYTECIMRWMK